MLKLIAGLALAFLASVSPALAQTGTVGPTNAIFCNQVAQMPAGPSAITQVIAAKAGKSIFVCGWHVTNTGATGTFSISYGTGTNCGTGTTAVIPALNVTSTAPSADHIDYAQLYAPAGNAVCITPSVATISAILYFSQF